jgi:hypothetical protein
MGLDFPVSMGGYAYSADPDQPVVLDCWHAAVDGDRELHVFERLKRGRYTMLERPFAEYEEHTRTQLLAAWEQATPLASGTCINSRAARMPMQPSPIIR